MRCKGGKLGGIRREMYGMEMYLIARAMGINIINKIDNKIVRVNTKFLTFIFLGK